MSESTSSHAAAQPKIETTEIDQSTRWWRDEARRTMGSRYSTTVVDTDSAWTAIIESGRRDLERAIRSVGFRTGTHLDAVEIGCGVARLTANLADHYRTVVGLDISPDVIDEARRSCRAANVRFEVSSGVDMLPGQHDCFDVVLSAETFHHLAPALVRRYMQDAFRVLRPGGQFAVHVNVARPGRWTWLSTRIRTTLFRLGVKVWRRWPTDPAFGRQYHRAEWVIDSLAQAGFQNARQAGESDRQAWFLAEKPGR